MSLPFTFTPFTTIYSAQVNANMQYLAIYDIAMGYSGTPLSSFTLFSFNVVRPFTLPVGLFGSVSSCTTAPSSTVVFTIQQNGGTIGTITFATSAVNGLASFSSAITFAAGDQITILTPANLYGLTNLSITLSGSRV